MKSVIFCMIYCEQSEFHIAPTIGRSVCIDKHEVQMSNMCLASVTCKQKLADAMICLITMLLILFLVKLYGNV